MQYFQNFKMILGGKIGEEEFQDLPEWMKEMLVIRVGEQWKCFMCLQLNFTH